MRKHLRAVIAAATLVAGTTATVGTASAKTTTATCAQVVLIGVRGSQQAAGTGDLGNTWSKGGLGPTVQGVADYVTAHTSKAVRVAGLKYPAALPSDLVMARAFVTGQVQSLGKPGSVYGNSKLAGANALRAELNALAKACPKTSTVLVGYSQGAHVIGDVIATSTRPQLSAAARSHIKAVALEADPAYRKAEPWDAAATIAGNGTFARGKGELASFNGTTVRGKGRVMSWCSSGDLFCQNNWGHLKTAADIHSNDYANPAHFKAVGGWIVGKL